jgi:hypothetical protein
LIRRGTLLPARSGDAGCRAFASRDWNTLIGGAGVSGWAIGIDAALAWQEADRVAAAGVGAAFGSDTTATGRATFSRSAAKITGATTIGDDVARTARAAASVRAAT